MMMSNTIFNAATFVTLTIAVISAPLSATHVRSYGFKGGTDGAYPAAQLTEDTNGNFYGTTEAGGLLGGNCPQVGCGTIFRLSRNASGKWAKAVIYQFTGISDGINPIGKLTIDTSGNLYGTAYYTEFDRGTVFELMSGQTGGWVEKTLYTFQGTADGGSPSSGVIFGSPGNLYGSTQSGGICNVYCGGVVFALTQNQNGSWTESVLYDFPLDASGYPTEPNSLILDSSGNLFGTTEGGGTYDRGTAFEMMPNQDGTWTQLVLYNFQEGLDGGTITSGITIGADGNLYGEATYGGSFACPGSGCGVIFELSPEAGGAWKETSAYTFHGLNGVKGSNPIGGLTLDTAGNLYGTAGGGTGACSGTVYPCGMIFKFSPANPNGTFRVIGSFNGIDGASPWSGVTVDAAGNIYGTAQAGGDLNCNTGDGYGCGTVFEIAP